MKQVAILGLSYFGKSVLDELLEMNVEVLIIDKDRDVVDVYKDSSATAIIMDDNERRKPSTRFAGHGGRGDYRYGG